MRQALGSVDDPVVMLSGVPIKKVRITKTDKTIRVIREKAPGTAFVKPGSIHHLCIFELDKNGKTERDAVFVSMLVAIGRIKRKEPVIQRKHPDFPNARFLMSLSSREMVLADCKGQQKLLVFETAASTSGQMWFSEHTDARKSSNRKMFSFMANTLQARKVTVDPLGRIRWAND